MEMKVKDGPMYHAHPNYCNEGPWQDSANHSGEMSTVCSKRFHPEYCSSISITLLMTMETRSMKSELLCRHAVTRVDRDHARQLRMEETHLCSCWQLSMKRGSSQDEVRVNVPKLYLVSAKDLKNPVLVFEENCGLCEPWQGKQYVWAVSNWQTEWSHMFPFLDD
jgi:hypothetical protein